MRDRTGAKTRRVLLSERYWTDVVLRLTSSSSNLLRVIQSLVNNFPGSRSSSPGRPPSSTANNSPGSRSSSPGRPPSSTANSSPGSRSSSPGRPPSSTANNNTGTCFSLRNPVWRCGGSSPKTPPPNCLDSRARSARTRPVSCPLSREKRRRKRKLRRRPLAGCLGT